MMMNHSTNALFFDNMEIPADSLIGQEGKGFSYILDGMNAERILVASDSLGDARWFIEKAVAYAGQRRDLRQAHRRQPGRPVPHRQGAHGHRGRRSHAHQGGRALRRRGSRAGPRPTWRSTSPPRRPSRRATPASTATAATGSPRSTTSSASSASARLYRTAPINNNLVAAYVGEHVLGMPRSY